MPGSYAVPRLCLHPLYACRTFLVPPYPFYTRLSPSPGDFLSTVVIWCSVYAQVELFTCEVKGSWYLHSLSVPRAIPFPPPLIGHAGARVYTSIGFFLFNLESINVFTLNYVAIYSDTSYPFGFTYKIKLTPFDIFKFIFTTLRNQDKKVAFIKVY